MPWRPEQALHSDSGLVGRPNPPAPLLPFAPLRGSATTAGRGREKPEIDDGMKVRAPSSHHQFPVTFQLQRIGRLFAKAAKIAPVGLRPVVRLRGRCLYHWSMKMADRLVLGRINFPPLP